MSGGFGRAFRAELAKQRRTFVWGLVALGPFGVVALQAANYAVRYDYLTNLYADDPWGGLIGNVKWLAVPALMAGLAIVASMLAGYEHATNAWKQTLALPVSKTAVYTAKVSVLTIQLLASCTLLAAGTLALGVALGHRLADAPLADVLAMSYLPLVAALPFVALQTWLSTVMHNQAVPLTVGILGTVLALYSFSFADWVPYKWPYVGETGWSVPLTLAVGAGTGLLLYALGATHFGRRDVR
ncbi:ABC transporter permease [Paenibacillus sp.]|uniref:ABC transporter permease n=1 Tax=Paenibacillus sp. TaxID=58172 RepID=UPI002811C582|nr:ABC transporter permease [Paenibacillus sp.]